MAVDTQTSRKRFQESVREEVGHELTPITESLKEKEYTRLTSGYGYNENSAASNEAAIWDYKQGKERDDLYATMDLAYNDPSSPFYNPYRQATNGEYTGVLSKYGIEVPQTITQDWIDQQLGVYGSYLETNPDGSLAKAKTKQQKIAQALYGLNGLEYTTQKAENELAEIRKTVDWYAKHGYSDEEIARVVGGMKHSTLDSLNITRNPSAYQGVDDDGYNISTKQGRFVQLNRPVYFDDDTLTGMIWKARNGVEDMSDFDAAVYAYRNQGILHGGTPSQQRKRTYGSSDYHPYADGCTNIEAKMEFGQDEFTYEDLKRLGAEVAASGDENQQKLINKLWSAEDRTENAEKELNWLRGQISGYNYGNVTIPEGKTAKDYFTGIVDNWIASGIMDPLSSSTGLKTLADLDKGRDRGQPDALNRSVDYRREDMIDQMLARYYAANGITVDPRQTLAPKQPETSQSRTAGLDIPEPPVKPAEEGNIDIDNRQVVQNEDGTFSTEESFSTNIDGMEVLLPTIIDGKRVSEDEAIAHYLETGENLGKFKTVEDAEAYAQWLHERQEKVYGQHAAPTSDETKPGRKHSDDYYDIEVGGHYVPVPKYDENGKLMTEQEAMRAYMDRQNGQASDETKPERKHSDDYYDIEVGGHYVPVPKYDENGKLMTEQEAMQAYMNRQNNRTETPSYEAPALDQEMQTYERRDDEEMRHWVDSHTTNSFDPQYVMVKPGARAGTVAAGAATSDQPTRYKAGEDTYMVTDKEGAKEFTADDLRHIMQAGYAGDTSLLSEEEKRMGNNLILSIPWAFTDDLGKLGLQGEIDSGAKRRMDDAARSLGEDVFAIRGALSSPYATTAEKGEISVQLFQDAMTAASQGMELAQWYANTEAGQEHKAQLFGIMDGVDQRGEDIRAEQEAQHKADSQALLAQNMALLNAADDPEKRGLLSPEEAAQVNGIILQEGEADHMFEDRTDPDTDIWNDAKTKLQNGLWERFNASIDAGDRDGAIRDLFGLSENDTSLQNGTALDDVNINDVLAEIDGITEIAKQFYAQDKKLAAASDMTLEEYYEAVGARKPEDLYRAAFQYRQLMNSEDSISEEAKQGIGFFGAVWNSMKMAGLDVASNDVGFVTDLTNMLISPGDYETLSTEYSQRYGFFEGRNQYRDYVNVMLSWWESQPDAASQEKAKAYREQMKVLDENGLDIFNLGFNPDSDQLERILKKVNDELAQTQEWIDMYATDAEKHGISIARSAFESAFQQTRATVISAVTGLPVGLTTTLSFLPGSFESHLQDAEGRGWDDTRMYMYAMIGGLMDSALEGEFASSIYNVGGDALAGFFKQGATKFAATHGITGLGSHLAYGLMVYAGNSVGEITQELMQNVAGGVYDYLWTGSTEQLRNAVSRETFIDTVLSTMLSTYMSTTAQQGIAAAQGAPSVFSNRYRITTAAMLEYSPELREAAMQLFSADSPYSRSDEIFEQLSENGRQSAITRADELGVPLQAHTQAAAENAARNVNVEEQTSAEQGPTVPEQPVETPDTAPAAPEQTAPKRTSQEAFDDAARLDEEAQNLEQDLPDASPAYIAARRESLTQASQEALDEAERLESEEQAGQERPRTSQQALEEAARLEEEAQNLETDNPDASPEEIAARREELTQASNAALAEAEQLEENERLARNPVQLPPDLALFVERGRAWFKNIDAKIRSYEEKAANAATPEEKAKYEGKARKFRKQSQAKRIEISHYLTSMDIQTKLHELVNNTNATNDIVQFIADGKVNSWLKSGGLTAKQTTKEKLAAAREASEAAAEAKRKADEAASAAQQAGAQLTEARTANKANPTPDGAKQEVTAAKKAADAKKQAESANEAAKQAEKDAQKKQDDLNEELTANLEQKRQEAKEEAKVEVQQIQADVNESHESAMEERSVTNVKFDAIDEENDVVEETPAEAPEAAVAPEAQAQPEAAEAPEVQTQPEAAVTPEAPAAEAQAQPEAPSGELQARLDALKNRLNSLNKNEAGKKISSNRYLIPAMVEAASADSDVEAYLNGLDDAGIQALLAKAKAQSVKKSTTMAFLREAAGIVTEQSTKDTQNNDGFHDYIPDRHRRLFSRRETPSGEPLRSPLETAQKLFSDLGFGLYAPTKRMNGARENATGVAESSTGYAAIRAHSANDSETLFHEIGHLLQHKYGLSTTQNMLDKANKKFLAAYPASVQPQEAFAEFVNAYVNDRDGAIKLYGQKDVTDFEDALRKNGVYDLMAKASLDIGRFNAADPLDRMHAMQSDVNRRNDKPRSREQERTNKIRSTIIDQVDDTYAGDAFDVIVDKNLDLRSNPELQKALGVVENLRSMKKNQARASYILKNELRTWGGTKLAEGLVPTLGEMSEERLQRLIDYSLAQQALSRMYHAEDKALEAKRKKAIDTLHEAHIRKGIEDRKYELTRGMSKEQAEGLSLSPEEIADIRGSVKYAPTLEELDLIDQTVRLTEEEAFEARQSTQVYNENVLSKEELEGIVYDIETNHKETVEDRERLSEWWDKFMTEYAVKSNLITKQEYENLKSIYPYYTPTFRDGKVTRDGVLEKIVGSDLKVMNPLEGFAHIVYQTVEKARNNITLQYIGDALNTESKNWTEINGEETAVPNGLGLLVRPVDGPGENTLSYKDKYGNTQYLEFADKELFEVIRDNASPAHVGDTLRNIGKVTRTISMLLTGSNPKFGLKNAFRDLQQGVIHGHWAYTLIDGMYKWAKAAHELRSNSEYAQQYKAMNGDEDYSFGGLAMTQKDADEFIRMFSPEHNLTTKDKAVEAAKKGWHKITLSGVNGFIEMNTRFAEYRYGKHDLSTEEGRQRAYLAAQESTTNFSLSGRSKLAVGLRSFISFYNATLQGTWSFARALTPGERKDLPRRIAKTALNNFILGALSVGLIKAFGSDDDKKEYENLADGIKYGYLNIPLPDSFYRSTLRFPISQNPAARAFYALGVNTMDSDDINDFVLSTAGVIGDILGDAIQTEPIFMPVLDVMRNRTHYGSYIIPQHMLDRNGSSTQRYKETTPEMFIKLARFFDNSLGEGWKDKFPFLTEPLALEYMAKQSTGFIGQMVFPLISPSKASGYDLNLISGSAALLDSIIRDFTVDSAYSNDISSTEDNLYSKLSNVVTDITNDGYSDKLNSRLSPEEAQRGVNSISYALGATGPIARNKAKIAELRELQDTYYDTTKYPNLGYFQRQAMARDVEKQINDIKAENILIEQHLYDTYCGGADFVSRVWNGGAHAGMSAAYGYPILAEAEMSGDYQYYNKAVNAYYDRQKEDKKNAYKINPVPKSTVYIPDSNGEDYKVDVNVIDGEAFDLYQRTFLSTFNEVASGITNWDSTDKNDIAVRDKAISKATSAAQKAANAQITQYYFDHPELRPENPGNK